MSRPLPPLESKKGLLYQHASPPQGRTIEIGTDEVGRGPLFGRTYAAAVVLPPLERLTPQDRAVLAVVRDSKSVPRAKIGALAADIRRVVRAFSVAFVDAEEIDAVNIRQAVILAMRRAVCGAAHQVAQDEEPEDNAATTATQKMYVFADGRDLPSPVELPSTTGAIDVVVAARLLLPVVTEAKADARYVSVACAAILAKDARDAYILELCALHPALSERYGLHQNMGYGTKAHMEGLVRHGPTIWHRQSFRPVREALAARLLLVQQQQQQQQQQETDNDERDDALALPRLRFFADRDGDDSMTTTKYQSGRMICGGSVFDDGVDEDV